MSAQKSGSEPDLTNVDYEDVLHLYRGWRKSEGALKDKNKELNAMKIRIKQLQDSHARFKGQIQALESVKELTVSLQTQLSCVQQENATLVQENKELRECNGEAEEMIRDRSQAEAQQERAFRELQVEYSVLRGRYEEMAVSQRDLETLAADEQAMRMSAEARLQSSEEAVERERTENRALKLRLDATTTRMNQCDQELAHASDQLSSLSR